MIKLLVVCKEKNKRNMELFYGDDETIELYPVVNDKNISPRLGFNYNAFKQITKNMDLYLARGTLFNQTTPEPLYRFTI